MTLQEEHALAQAEVEQRAAEWDDDDPLTIILFYAAVQWRDLTRRRLYSQRTGG